MRTLDKYTLGEFVRATSIGLVGFVVIFISLDMVENVDDFIDNNVPFPTVLKYYLYQVPHIFTLTLPIAVLISSLFTIGQMARHNELVAMRASGIRLSRAILPIVVGGLIASVVSIGVGEGIEPHTNAVVKTIKETQIKKTSRKTRPRIRTTITYRGRNGLFYFAPEFDSKLNTMKNVVVEKYSHGSLIFRLNATKATWEDSIWIFHDAWIRWFSKEGDIKRDAHIERGSFASISDYPEDILREQKNPEEMSFWELRRLIERINESGGDSTRYQVGLNMKIAFPFTNLIVVLIGTPLASRLRRGGIAVGVGLGLAVCFLYYGFIRVGQAMGDHGVLPPLLAAWLGNIFFAICGIILILRAEKF